MKNHCRLSPWALGLSLGLTWGVSLFIMGLLALYASYGEGFVVSIGSLYYGYAPTLLGSVIGAAIGFVDAFICGVIVAWLYNCFTGCCKKEGK